MLGLFLHWFDTRTEQLQSQPPEASVSNTNFSHVSVSTERAKPEGIVMPNGNHCEGYYLTMLSYLLHYMVVKGKFT